MQRKYRPSPVLFVIFIALTLRLLFVLVIDAHPKLAGGDTWWYMEVGHDLITTGTTKGPIQTGPLFPLFVGVIQYILPGETDRYSYAYDEVQTIRILQAFMGALLCLFVYIIASRLFLRRVGLWAAIIVAIGPTFIIESGHIVTESLFLFLFYGSFALYLGSLHQLRPRILLAVGVLLALATLTRAVALIFPVVIVAHLFFRERRRWLVLAAVMLLGYVPLVSTWTIYNVIEWDRVVIGGEGIMSFLYQGAEGVGSPTEIDEQLGVTGGDPGVDVRQRQEALEREVRESILNDLTNWMGHRLKELASACLQPHNTNYFPGQSIRDAASFWLQHDRSLDGLLRVLGIQNFGPKLLLYLYHFGVSGLGVIGMAQLLDRWKVLLVLYGVVVYFTGIHLALLALPRYLFPMMPTWIVFGCAVIGLWREKKLSIRTYRCESSRSILFGNSN